LIPKIIHYVWIGDNPKNDLIKQCIESWKYKLPDYEIVEWNEKNYDLNSNIFLKKAYSQKKWAFVADYIRLDVLLKYGGIYFDTDVEVIKTFDDLLNNDAFIGFENSKYLGTSVIAAKPNHRWIAESLKYYSEAQSLDKKGNISLTPNVVNITDTTVKMYGLKLNNKNQSLNDRLIILSSSYFSPISYDEDFKSSSSKITKETYSIHHYDGSWLDKKDHFKIFLKKTLKKLRII